MITPADFHAMCNGETTLILLDKQRPGSDLGFFGDLPGYFLTLRFIGSQTEADDDGLRSLLTKGDRSHLVFVPWSAMLEILHEASGVSVRWSKEHAPPPSPPPQGKKRGHLRVISGGKQ